MGIDHGIPDKSIFDIAFDSRVQKSLSRSICHDGLPQGGPGNRNEESINAGVDDFFQKPISFSRLLLHLEKGLTHRRDLVLKKGLEEELKKLNTKTLMREETTTSNAHQIT